MNIKEAKNEVMKAVKIYLEKDEHGEYRVPVVRQRPLFLQGAPGLGKTAIMEQVASELDIALVSYSMTHHTRQSAIGLPFLKEVTYGGKTYTKSEYTMSEIIASVYDVIEKTGKKEGILFLDEINCVSETLAPMMLQFLQGKTFGNQKVPEGWVIVTAGNPPEYNKSVREFDVVTLDRIKRIDVQPDFEVWKEYAYEQGIHPAVISYLELRRKNFYRMENTVDGRIFATARGWEDLSRLIQVYETLDKEVDREVVYQYIQHPMIAKDFAAYLALYNKYKTDYAVEDLLQGKWTPITLGKIRNASLDEHLSIVGLLNGKLSQLFADCYFMDAYVTKLYGYMTEYRDNLPEMTLESIYKKAENDFQTAKKSELLTKNEEKVFIRTVDFLEKLWIELRGETGSEDKTENNKAVEISEKDTYERAKTAFATEADSLETQTEYISQTLQNVFDFMEAAFGDSQEMVAFITELNANFYSIWFIRENGSDQYYRHNKGLLFDDRQKLILGQMEELENTMKRGLKN